MNGTIAGLPEDRLKDVLTNLDDVFLISNGIIVCLMQVGFCCLELGAVRSKNATSIIIKNVLDLFVSGVCYWLVGFPLAWGDGDNVVGSSGWAGIQVGDDGQPRHSLWFFQLIFAATAATIVSGAVAERCRFTAYLAYSAAISGVIYPMATRWVWNPVGWLSVMGAKDFAGSGVLHALGGTASLVAAAVLGPRKGRFKDSHSMPIAGHSVPMFGIGTLLLVTGFLAFNAGSQGHMTQPGDGAAISLAASNTILSGAGGALVALGAGKLGLVCGSPSKWLTSASANGILSGCVAICAGANVLPLWGAFVTGAGGSAVFLILRKLLTKLRVDDPLDAVPVHLGAGAWGTLIFPLLQQQQDRFQLLSANALGLVVVLGWTAATSGLLFGALHFAGLLRVSPDQEEEGLDTALYGEAAYPELAAAEAHAATMQAAAAHAATHGNTLPIGARPSMIFSLNTTMNERL